MDRGADNHDFEFVYASGGGTDLTLDFPALVITGLDLSAGFSLTGTADFDIGDNQDGSRVMYQAKVGTVVPIPAAAWLFGSALLGMAGIGYRKSRMA